MSEDFLLGEKMSENYIAKLKNVRIGPKKRKMSENVNPNFSQKY